jgi:hypothetical protein
VFAKIRLHWNKNRFFGIARMYSLMEVSWRRLAHLPVWPNDARQQVELS